MSESDILRLIAGDAWRMRILHAAASVDLTDWLIGAGFVRNKVWDHLHGYETDTPPSDIDLVFFDRGNTLDEKALESELSALVPGVNWEVTNQATAHISNEEEPYASTADAISKWPETATSVGVTLRDGGLSLVAPLGIDDLVGCVARPTPTFQASAAKRGLVRARIEKKQWKEKWPMLRILDL